MFYRSLPGPLLSIAALFLTVTSAAAFDDAIFPPWKGQWARIGDARWDIGKPRLAQQAPLTPEYQDFLQWSIADQRKGGHGNDLMYQCWPPGMPRIMLAYYPLEFKREHKPIWVEHVCAEDRHIELGVENYLINFDGHLMPTRKDQPPPDLRKFDTEPTDRPRGLFRATRPHATLRSLTSTAERLYPHPPHQRFHMTTADLAPFGSQQAAQHPRARKRELQMQPIETTHDRKISVRHWPWQIVDAATADVQSFRLFRDRQVMLVVDHRFALSKPALPSAPSKNAILNKGQSRLILRREVARGPARTISALS